ncbi:Glycogen accumulation regulator GarA [Novipirellula aureliae]|uniref:Glycogen accumulation regulator GarA n=1 Tax=Novipirellula aureliae TaxID=2527966 RepID=A0A5C6EEX3_9BACT|nr:FHA domain-containing protein [Novipirellula aureliae]TWU45749.1 Glycogen accumulation regulator GarA [Novipirellula aureliae]
MRVVIIVESGPRPGARWLLRPGETMVFGRTERADVILGEDPSLSSRHFHVSIEGDACVIEDLQSTNGTWMNDEPIRSIVLNDGDRIRAGQFVFAFQFDSSYATHPIVPSPITTDHDPHSAAAEIPLPPADLAPADLAPADLPEWQSPPTAPAETTPPKTLSNQDTVPEDEFSEFETRATEPATSPPAFEVPRTDISDTNVPEIPKIKKKPSPPLGHLELQLHRCPSGLMCATQLSAWADPSMIVERLAFACPTTFIVDFGRTQLAATEAVDETMPDYLLANIPPAVAAEVSPRMVPIVDPQQRVEWVQNGWGSNGMIVLFSQVPVFPLLEHYQRLMGTAKTDTGKSSSFVGLCWPSVLDTVLNNGKPEFAAEIAEPCETILLQCNQSPGGWRLFGNDRLEAFLTQCQIPVQVDKS